MLHFAMWFFNNKKMLMKLGVSALFITSACAACWSESKGYSCCKETTIVVSEDSDGQWGIENGNWCGIPKEEPGSSCWAESQGYNCCPPGTKAEFVDNSGSWGVVNNEWCGIVEDKPVPKTCWSEKLGFPCCTTTTKVEYTDSDGKWGTENGEWCGLDNSVVITTARKTTTTTRRTTTTTRRTTTVARRATYSVIYKAENKLESGYENWGWDSQLTFKDNAMKVVADPRSYGAVSIKNMRKDYGKGGSIRFDVKSTGRVNVRVESTDEKENILIGNTNGDDSDFRTYKFDIDVNDFPYSFDRITLEDGSGNGDPFYIRYLIYSTGSASDFVDPIDTSYVPPVTTRKPVSRAVYTTIFKSVSSMPSGYDN
ncbi:galactose-binding like protein [Neocallimastix lanati (nom. inval.)]|uniref:Galactose-binding like protein n=1 Tax=Neocallimastix californiae TaxID=1754190 RepID=A0A1Y1ZUE6_9FUNG|nr:galactose-binding like protein [Neocallimastix sp. JGI-2020a]ORY13879.1 galactose-binding like protein [Neocallimastix californiae]|eukprot:ORY13879.1 galactose-binding like protein [Neocallimastix californiae]